MNSKIYNIYIFDILYLILKVKFFLHYILVIARIKSFTGIIYCSLIVFLKKIKFLLVFEFILYL